jgi:hypothetical protein
MVSMPSHRSKHSAEVAPLARYGENFSLYSLSVEKNGKKGGARCEDAFQVGFACVAAAATFGYI